MVSLSFLFIIGIVIVVIVVGFFGFKNRSSAKDDILDDDF